MAATLAITYPVPEFDLATGGTEGVLVATAQTFKPFQFVKLSSGKLTAASSADTTIHGFCLAPAVDPVTSVLTGDPNSSTYGGCPYIRVKPGMRFEMNLTGKTLAQTDVGAQYGLLVTANICTVDGTNTTQKVFQVVEIPQTPTILDGGIGDTNARVIVEVIISTIV